MLIDAAIKDDMFYKAGPLIFRKAEELRNRCTDTEELLWNYLRQNQLGVKFRRQHPASNYVLDFYAHKIKLAIEIDGSIHEVDEVKRNDKIRQMNLESFGICFLRFSNGQIKYNLEEVVHEIKVKVLNMLKENSTATSSPLGAGGLQIIPAIDIIDGKCVRLTEGDYSQKKIYNEHPLEVAKEFEDAGLQRLHLVDLDGAKAGAVKNWKVLEAITSKTSLIIDFGGGIKQEEDVKIVLNSGAAFATVGSIAVKDEATFVSWLQQFGAAKFLLGADVKNEKIAVGGWLETTDVWIYDFIEKYINHGVQQIFCTDVSKDGRLEGPSTELYKNIIQKFPELHFIASGGVSSMKDLDELAEIGCNGVIIGKAIYEGRVTLNELKRFNS